MSLNTVANGNTIFAADINQLVNVLQQPSGGQEKGYYYLNGWGTASGDVFGYGVPLESRNATPVSVSVDTSVQAATNVVAPATNALTSSGFHVFTNTTGVNANGYVGGIYTVQY
jgi:hypothetical protein